MVICVGQLAFIKRQYIDAKLLKETKTMYQIEYPTVIECPKKVENTKTWIKKHECESIK